MLAYDTRPSAATRTSQRPGPGPRPGDPASRPSPNAASVRAPDRPRWRRVILHVGALDFERSAVGLARQLRSWAGVRAVQVDAAAALAVIEYDAHRFDVTEVARLVATCGYACATVCDGACRAHPTVPCATALHVASRTVWPAQADERCGGRAATDRHGSGGQPTAPRRPPFACDR